MQEQDELFPKWRVGHDHPVQPPRGKGDELLIVVVVEARDVRLCNWREGRDL